MSILDLRFMIPNLCIMQNKAKTGGRPAEYCGRGRVARSDSPASQPNVCAADDDDAA